MGENLQWIFYYKTYNGSSLHIFGGREEITVWKLARKPEEHSVLE